MLSLLPLLLVTAQDVPPLRPPGRGSGRWSSRCWYAGRADSERSERFAAYLEQHFTQVGRADYSSYTAADAEGYDVVILDCEIIPPEGAPGHRHGAVAEAGLRLRPRDGGHRRRGVRLRPHA